MQRRWERHEFADFASWAAQWLDGGRPARCSIERGTYIVAAVHEPRWARARTQFSSRTRKEEPQANQLFVEWRGGPDISVERRHFRSASCSDDDQVVVIELFAAPAMVIRIYRALG